VHVLLHGVNVHVAAANAFATRAEAPRSTDERPCTRAQACESNGVNAESIGVNADCIGDADRRARFGAQLRGESAYLSARGQALVTSKVSPNQSAAWSLSHGAVSQVPFNAN
jgi:hypothetical protein